MVNDYIDKVLGWQQVKSKKFDLKLLDLRNKIKKVISIYNSVKKFKFNWLFLYIKSSEFVLNIPLIYYNLNLALLTYSNIKKKLTQVVQKANFTLKTTFIHFKNIKT